MGFKADRKEGSRARKREARSPEERPLHPRHPLAGLARLGTIRRARLRSFVPSVGQTRLGIASRTSLGIGKRARLGTVRRARLGIARAVGSARAVTFFERDGEDAEEAVGRVEAERGEASRGVLPRLTFSVWVDFERRG